MRYFSKKTVQKRITHSTSVNNFIVFVLTELNSVKTNTIKLKPLLIAFYGLNQNKKSDEKRLFSLIYCLICCLIRFKTLKNSVTEHTAFSSHDLYGVCIFVA